MIKKSVAVMGWTLWDGQGKTLTGGSAVTYELTRRLSKFFNCEMVFEISDRKNAGKVEDTNAGFTKRFILRPKLPWRLDEEFLKKYDLIHLWDRVPIFTYRAYTKTFIPHCHTLHSAASMISWIRIASVFYIPEHDIITLGSLSLAEALAKFWKTPIDVIPYGVDVETFKPMDKRECRERLNIPRNRFIIGCLGRPRKLDFTLIYDTVRKVKELTRRDDIMLLIAGGSREIKQTYVSDDFLHLGYLDKNEIPLMLNSCDLFLNPTAGVQEGFGLSVIEAMACGLPIITTSWNGYTDTVTDDTGFLAGTLWFDGDVWINQNDLVSACIRLIKDEALREKCGRRARKRVEKKYTWEHCVDKYRRRFLNLIQKSPPEKLPYEDAPEKISMRINGETRVYSLEEAFRMMKELRIDFHQLYQNFVLNEEMLGDGWRKFMCIDNILNLPKYRRCMKDALMKEEERLKTYFPKLVNALSG